MLEASQYYSIQPRELLQCNPTPQERNRLGGTGLESRTCGQRRRPVALKRCDMMNMIVRVLAEAVMAVLATPASSAEPTQVERVRAAHDRNSHASVPDFIQHASYLSSHGEGQGQVAWYRGIICVGI